MTAATHLTTQALSNSRVCIGIPDPNAAEDMAIAAGQALASGAQQIGKGLGMVAGKVRVAVLQHFCPASGAHQIGKGRVAATNLLLQGLFELPAPTYPPTH